MMMVPSSFMARQPPIDKHRSTPRQPRRDSKPVSQRKAENTPDKPTRTTSSPTLQIPTQRSRQESTIRREQRQTKPESSTSPKPVHPPTMPKSSSAGSVESLLAATSIPVRRKPKARRSQRLPGDHVVDFSRLLSEDMQSRDDVSLSGSISNPQFELLFGATYDNMEDGMFVGSEGTGPPQLSIRSLSSDSMPSLDMDEDSTGASFIESTEPSPATERRTPDRRVRIYSSSQDCAEDHPLSRPWEEQSKKETLADLGRWSPEARSNLPPRYPPQKGRSSFRSNLTASLRAIRSAAQAVSNFAATSPAHKPDDFLTRSIFSFSPELTDDKRPPPLSDPPPPALRRYLNPDRRPLELHSPSEFYSYSDLPSVNTPSLRPDLPIHRSNSPASIQLQTCLPPAIRSPSGSASSPPRFGVPTESIEVKIGASSTPSSHNLSSRSSLDGEEDQNTSDELAYNAHTSFQAPNLARQREPRENPHFLRILVCEMQMRRSGKFGETVDGRACIWLPPRREVNRSPGQGPSERWKALTAADI